MIGLPSSVTALLFDLDGVLTSTAVIHSQAWKQAFDTFLQTYPAGDATQKRPFDQNDYLQYVDGRSRDDGITTFLRSRNITLPPGSPDDGPHDATVAGIGNTKNALFLEILKTTGAQAYPDAVAYLKAAQEAQLAIAVVTSSKNGAEILRATGLESYVQARVDGLVIAEQGLAGKPAPDSFLAGAKALGVAPAQAAVFEDAVSGVQAGHAGAFGHVVGVDRTDGDTHRHELKQAGADVVVDALTELLDPR
ncbi:HAD family hydrolase [Williamsia sp. R60]